MVVCFTLKQAWMKSQRSHLPRYLQPAVLFRQLPVRWHRVFQDRQSQSFSRQLQWPLDSTSSPWGQSLRMGNMPSPPTASLAVLMVGSVSIPFWCLISFSALQFGCKALRVSLLSMYQVVPWVQVVCFQRYSNSSTSVAVNISDGHTSVHFCSLSPVAI